jgi:hypothetical protein
MKLRYLETASDADNSRVCVEIDAHLNPAQACLPF